MDDIAKIQEKLKEVKKRKKEEFKNDVLKKWRKRKEEIFQRKNKEEYEKVQRMCKAFNYFFEEKIPKNGEYFSSIIKEIIKEKTTFCNLRIHLEELSKKIVSVAIDYYDNSCAYTYQSGFVNKYGGGWYFLFFYPNREIEDANYQGKIIEYANLLSWEVFPLVEALCDKLKLKVEHYDNREDGGSFSIKQENCFKFYFFEMKS